MKKAKKIISSFILILILLLTALNVSSNHHYKIQKNIYNIKLDFYFSDPSIEIIKINNEIYHRVKIDGLSNTFHYNKPIIPVKSLKILIPYNMQLDEIDINIDPKVLIKSGINLEFGRNLIKINNDTITDKIISNKSKEKLNDNHFISIVGEYKIRGYPILYVNLYPIQFDNKFGNLFFYRNIELNIKLKKSNDNTYIRGLQRDIELVNKLVDNPSYLNTYNNFIGTIKNDKLDYLIITNKYLLDSNLSNNFIFFAQSKNDRNISTEIITVEEIINNPDFFVNGTWGDNNPNNPFYQSKITQKYELFNDTQAKIRNYIRYAYYELGIDYILLGGDADADDETENIIPYRGLFANESGLPLYNSFSLGEEEDDIPSDIYYSNLDGNFNYDLDEHYGECADRNDLINIDEADLLSEVFVGRACVDNEEELSNFVMKTLGYQNIESDPYLSKILFVGENLGFPGVSAFGGNYKDLIKPIVPTNYNIETLYDRDLANDWNKNDIIDIINKATPHIINHDGHSYYGYNMRMSNDDVEKLINTKYFFAYSHGCMAGGFDNPGGYDCIAEHFTVENRYGAFAVIMNSRYGLGSENSLDSPSQFLDNSFFKALFKNNIREIGKANHYSKEDNIWRIDENGVRWVYYETNLFGDPETSIKNPYQINTDIIINLTKPLPKCLYLFNRKICEIPFFTKPLIIGDIIIQTNINSIPEGNIYYVEFYIDNESKYRDTIYPYEWKLDSKLFGNHRITISAFSFYGNNEYKYLDVIIFNKGSSIIS
jgi:hypothetical protein